MMIAFITFNSSSVLLFEGLGMYLSDKKSHGSEGDDWGWRWQEIHQQPQRDRGRTLGTMCTCEEIERGTHAQRASELGPVERWWT